MKLQVEQFYSQLINQQLFNGYQIINERITQPQFFLSSLKFLSQNKTNLILNMHICTLLTPFIQQVWQEYLNSEQKKVQLFHQEIRQSLLQAILPNHMQIKNIKAIAILISQILYNDEISMWIQSFKEVINWMGSEENRVIEAGIQFFLTLLNNHNKLHSLSSQLLQQLFQLFAQSEVAYILTRQMSKGKKQLFFCTQLQNHLQLLMESRIKYLFVSALQTSPTKHLVLKKYILKCLTVIFRDMPVYSSKSLLQNLTIFLKYINSTVPLYTCCCIYGLPIKLYTQKVNTSQLPINECQENLYTWITDLQYFTDEYEEYHNDVQALMFQIVQFIGTIISVPSLYYVIKISLYHVNALLCHIIITTNQQQTNMIQNSNYYQTQCLQQQQLNTIRIKVLNILNQLIQQYLDNQKESMLLICQSFLQNYSAEQMQKIVNQLFDKITQFGVLKDFDKTSSIELAHQICLQIKQKNYNRKKKQVGLFVLSRFAQDIIVFQTTIYSFFDINTFITSLLDLFPTHPILEGQSIWCMIRYTQLIGLKSKQLFIPMLSLIFKCVSQQKAISVRWVACRAISVFIKKLQKYKLKKLDLKEQQMLKVIQDLFKMYYSTEDYHISIFLEALYQLSIYKKQFSRIIQKNYSVAIIQIFSYHFTGNFIKNLIKQILNEESKTLVKTFEQFIFQCIKTYNNILTDENKIDQLKPKDIQIASLSILNLMIINLSDHYCEQILKSLVQGIRKNKDMQLQIAFSISIKNFIKFVPNFILKKDLLKYILQTIDKLLQIPTDKNFEGSSLYIGNIIILTFNNLMNGSVDNNILKKVVYKVFKSRTPSIIQSLVLVYSRIINSLGQSNSILSYDSQKLQSIIEFLCSFSFQNRMALKILIDKWLLQQALFRGKLIKNSTFLALTKLFMVKDKRLMNLLVIAFNPSHMNINSDVEAPLKILSTLIRCLDNQCSRQNDNSTKHNSIEQQENQIEQINIEDFSNEQQLINVNLQKFKEEQYMEVKLKNSTDKGLADLEGNGSTCFYTDMLYFHDDGQECDQTTEQDLQYLKDKSTLFELSTMLKEFFQQLIKSDNKYFKDCLKKLLKEDIILLNKYIKFK